MNNHFFLAGTDTDVGKTFISAALLMAAGSKGKATLGLKPVAAGCKSVDGALINSDAEALMAVSTVKLDYHAVNPIALEEPIAPHIAAAKNNMEISAASLVTHCESLLAPENWVIIEGAGGWRVPLNSLETLAELPKSMKLPIILVVGLKLGCLNHALLTIEAIESDGLELVGWVANQIDPEMAEVNENLATLNQKIQAPCLGVIPYQSTPNVDQTALLLDIEKISDW